MRLPYADAAAGFMVLAMCQVLVMCSRRRKCYCIACRWAEAGP